jgi:hypothetical protein
MTNDQLKISLMALERMGDISKILRKAADDLSNGKKLVPKKMENLAGRLDWWRNHLFKNIFFY